MKKAKTIKIFPAPHVEIRLHVSEEMEEDFKKCYFSEGMYSCRKCSWCKVKMEGTIICRFSTFKREMLRPMVPAAEFEKYGFKQCKGKWYENCYYLCVARGCVMLFVSDVCFDVFCWNEADPRIHKKPNCRYRDKRDYLDIVYDLIKAGLLTSEYEVRKNEHKKS